MFKLFVDICVGVMLCNAQVETVKPDVYLTAENYNECRITMYQTEDGYTEVKPDERINSRVFSRSAMWQVYSKR